MFKMFQPDSQAITGCRRSRLCHNIPFGPIFAPEAKLNIVTQPRSSGFVNSRPICYESGRIADPPRQNRLAGRRV